MCPRIDEVKGEGKGRWVGGGRVGGRVEEGAAAVWEQACSLPDTRVILLTRHHFGTGLHAVMCYAR